jgi:hypothetical protein
MSEGKVTTTVKLGSTEFEAASSEKRRAELSNSIELRLQSIDNERHRLDLVERGIVTLGNSERLRKSIDERRRSIEQQLEALTVIASAYWRKTDGRRRW